MSTVNRFYESKPAKEGLSFSEFTVKLHYQVYRSCCNGIIGAAGTVFKTAVFPAEQCLRFARKASLVDIAWTSTLKIVNGSFFAVFGKELIDKEHLKTFIQKKHEQEVIQLRNSFGEKSIYPQFCKATAGYIDEFIPKFIAEKLAVIPRSTEAWILFKLGYTIRYINYQLNKRLLYQERLLNSGYGISCQAKFDGLRTRLSHLFFDGNQLKAAINFEHLLLHVFTKLSGSSKQSFSGWSALALQSLADSLSQQKQIDLFLRQHQFNSEEEAFIARLEWHKMNHTLPDGLPDPQQEGLTVQNLQGKLDEALSRTLEGRIRGFLNELFVKYFKSGLLKTLYYLEGEDLLTGIFTYLIAEFGIKQLADPHLFTLAILFSSGTEVMDYELDGFGRGKSDIILETGQKIMAEALARKTDRRRLVEIYKESGLKNAPGSLEGIFQKQEAKERLKSCLASIVYKAIKTDEYQHPGGAFKNAREKAGRLPVIGAATICMHLLINGSLFSLGYLFRAKHEEDVSYLSWMFKHLSGRDLANFLAEKIVDLVYHPSWRITLLQLIDKLLAGWEQLHKKPQGNNSRLPLNPSKKDFLKVMQFLFLHFGQGASAPFQKSISPLFNYLAGDGAFKLFLDSLRPGEKPFLETALQSLLPSIKEMLLYTRVVESFRLESLYFEGDAKFWECFVREYLNQTVVFRLGQRRLSQENRLQQIAQMRETIIDELLASSPEKLRTAFAAVPVLDIESRSWIKVANVGVDEDFVVLTTEKAPADVQEPAVAGIKVDP